MLSVFNRKFCGSDLAQRVGSEGLRRSVAVRPFARGVARRCLGDSVLTLDSGCRNFKLILVRTVDLNIPYISFSYPFNPSRVVEGRRSKLLIGGKSVRKFTGTLYRLVRRRTREGTFNGETGRGVAHCSLQGVVPR